MSCKNFHKPRHVLWTENLISNERIEEKLVILLKQETNKGSIIYCFPCFHKMSSFPIYTMHLTQIDICDRSLFETMLLLIEQIPSYTYEIWWREITNANVCISLPVNASMTGFHSCLPQGADLHTWNRQNYNISFIYLILSLQAP